MIFFQFECIIVRKFPVFSPADLEHWRSFFPVHLHVDIHNRFPPVFVGVGFVPPVLRLFPDLRQGVVFLRRGEIRRQRQQQRARGKNPFHLHVRFLLRPQPFICIERQRGESSRIFEKNFLLFRRVLSLWAKGGSTHLRRAAPVTVQFEFDIRR